MKKAFYVIHPFWHLLRVLLVSECNEYRRQPGQGTHSPWPGQSSELQQYLSSEISFDLFVFNNSILTTELDNTELEQIILVCTELLTFFCFVAHNIEYLKFYLTLSVIMFCINGYFRWAKWFHNSSDLCDSFLWGGIIPNKIWCYPKLNYTFQN